MALRTLIVDDSIMYRKILSEVISEIPDIELIDTASNGSIALKKMAQKPVDLVLLDVVMPEMDGIETLRNIRENFPNTSVVMISGITKEAANVTIQALKMGALEFICKPIGENYQTNIEQLKIDIRSVLRVWETKNLLKRTQVLTHPKTKVPQISDERSGKSSYVPVSKTFGIVVIGVSTGGPDALSRLVPNLPSDLSVPVLVVQHMPPNFTAALAEDLNRKSSIHVVEAEEGMPVKAGTVILAKGGFHMVVRMQENQPVIGVNEGPPENSCRPSVDVLFRSVANCYADKGVLSVILTGMGADGLAGVRALKRKRCYSITQSAETCVVYGMPRSIDEAGLSDESLNLEEISKRIV